MNACIREVQEKEDLTVLRQLLFLNCIAGYDVTLGKHMKTHPLVTYLNEDNASYEH